MQVSDQDREPSRRERNKFGIAAGGDELQPLARRVVELRERRRWLGKEIAFVDCRIAEARFERGQLRGRGRRKRRHGDALSSSLTQLARQRDGLVRQLDAAEIAVGFELAQAMRGAWDAVAESFEALRRCNGIANLPVPETDGMRRGVRQGSVPERPLLFPPPERWEAIRSQVAPLHLRNGAGEDLLFFPGFLLLHGQEGEIALVDLRDLKFSILDAPMPATPVAAGAMTGVSTLPTAQRAERGATRPARLLLTSDSGLREIFDIGDRKRCGAFVEAVARYQSSLPDEEAFVTAEPDPAERLPSLEIPERFELPTLPPRSRWPAAVTGLAAAVALLWVMDRAATGGAFDRLLGGAGAALSQASDGIVALFTEEPESGETQTAESKSASAEAIGTTASEREQTPEPQGSTEVAPPQPATAPSVASVQSVPLAEPGASDPAQTDPENVEPGAGLANLDPAPAVIPSTVQPATPPLSGAGADPETAAEPVREPTVEPAPEPVARPEPASPASPNPAIAALPDAAEPSEAAAAEVEVPPVKAVEPAAMSMPFASTAPGLAPGEIAALQRKLEFLGFRPGAPDGVAGKRTLAAVQEFQRARGLSRTTSIDRGTLELVLADGSPQRLSPKPFIPSPFVPSPFATTTTFGSSTGVGQLRTYPWPYAHIPRPLTASERGR